MKIIVVIGKTASGKDSVASKIAELLLERIFEGDLENEI